MSLLEIQQLDKQFGGNMALDKIDIVIQPGEIHSLVGENGAGKSTLIKIITGVYQPTNGYLKWEGNIVRVQNPSDSQQLGIHVIHQDRQLVPSFTGLENLYLNRPYPVKKRSFGIDWKEVNRHADTLQQEWGIRLPLSKLVSDMSPSERTMLEILRALMMESKLFILDEPTASLTNKESELLFSFIRRLQQKGVSILYVSHRLEEVIELSDQVTVLIGGKVATTLAKENLTKETIIHHMTGGKEIKAVKSPFNEKNANEPLLVINGLKTKDERIKDIKFTLHKGEILGIYGLAGAGRTELLETIYGLRKVESGVIHFNDEPLINLSPTQSIKKGIVLIPENRHEDALIMNNTIRENISLPVLHFFTRNGIILKKKELQTIQTELSRFQVKATGSEQQISELSGGNQQKVVFAKALLSNPDIYLCDEPTQAVDVMTRTDIHQFLRERAAEGKGIVFVSSDLSEVIEMSDRIIVLNEGEIVADLKNEQLQPQHILDYCF